MSLKNTFAKKKSKSESHRKYQFLIDFVRNQNRVFSKIAETFKLAEVLF